MATNLNAFTIMGNATSDPKVITRQNGPVAVMFQVAVNRGNNTDFIPVQLHGAQYNEGIKAKLVKGAPVLLHGRVEYTNSTHNGENRKFFAIQPSFLQIGPNGNMNNGSIYGRLTADPIVRQTSTGTRVATVTIACNRSYKDQNGEWKDAPPTFIEVVCWDKLGDFVCQYFKKGSAIVVSGHLHSNNYKDKDGNTRTSYSIVAHELSFADAREEKCEAETEQENPYEPERTNQRPAVPHAQSAAIAQGFAIYSPEDFQAVAGDDDLPF